MTSDERMMNMPDERIATALDPIDDVRGHPEGPVVNQSAEASVQPAAPATADRPVEQPRRVRPPKADPNSGVLFDEGEVSRLRNRWADIQNGFVDEPRRAVK